MEERVLLHGGSPADSLAAYLPPRHDLVQRGGFLTAPTPGDPRQVALSYLAGHAADLGLTPADVSQAVVTDQYTDPDTGTTHIYLRQTYNGLEVANANLNINLTADNRVINVGGGFVPGLTGRVGLDRRGPGHHGVQALQGAASGLGLTLAAPTGRRARRSAGRPEAWSSRPATCRSTRSPPTCNTSPRPRASTWPGTWSCGPPTGITGTTPSVDATSGTLVAANDWVDHASYNVFALPTESPDDGPRTILTNPNDPTASPFGWHDTNGVAGAEFTDTRGNNVSAQEDADANDTGGFRPDGGASLNFNFPLDLTQDPSAYQSAAITQLFYMNNLLHDIHYHYGFTEAAGNFQVNNYGRGGAGQRRGPGRRPGRLGHRQRQLRHAAGRDCRRGCRCTSSLSTFPNRDGDLDNGDHHPRVRPRRLQPPDRRAGQRQRPGRPPERRHGRGLERLVGPDVHPARRPTPQNQATRHRQLRAGPAADRRGHPARIPTAST